MTEFKSFLLIYVVGGEAHLYSANDSVVRVIFTPFDYEKAMREFHVDDVIDGIWGEDGEARSFQMLKPPIRWKDGQIFLELKEVSLSK